MEHFGETELCMFFYFFVNNQQHKNDISVNPHFTHLKTRYLHSFGSIIPEC